MWAGFDPKPYTREEYAAHVDALPHLPWVRFIVLHNTGSPTLAQWLDGGVSEEQRLDNLEHYYEVIEHWHSGPHGFITPTHICGFADPTKPGVLASCFNHLSLGFEMVGDYSTEAFDSGPGAAVRDNAVFALALWHRKLGLRPDNYLYGVRGLHFHHDCIRDHHDCPGRSVSKPDLVARVLAKMAELGGAPTPVVSLTVPLSPQPGAIAPPTLDEGAIGPDVSRLQDLLNRAANAGLAPDGDFGAKTRAAVAAFQALHGLPADGIAGPATWTALEAAAP